MSWDAPAVPHPPPPSAVAPWRRRRRSPGPTWEPARRRAAAWSTSPPGSTSQGQIRRATPPRNLHEEWRHFQCPIPLRVTDFAKISGGKFEVCWEWPSWLMDGFALSGENREPLIQCGVFLKRGTPRFTPCFSKWSEFMKSWNPSFHHGLFSPQLVLYKLRGNHGDKELHAFALFFTLLPYFPFNKITLSDTPEKGSWYSEESKHYITLAERLEEHRGKACLKNPRGGNRL